VILKISLAEYLDIIFLHIHAWMCSQSPNADGQNPPSDEVNSDQLNGRTQPNECADNEPAYSAQNAKSITDSDSQTKRHNNDQAIQHNCYSAAVVDIEKEEKEEILQSLGKLGISYLKAKELIEKHGQKRIAEVVKHARDQECKNPAGYVIRALKENWTFSSVLENRITPVEMD
jgi:hypothetical protein